MAVTSRIEAPAVYLHVGHERLSSGSGGVYEHRNPVSAELLARVPLAGAAEINRAVAKAEAAFDAWRRMPPESRGDLLRKLASLVEADTRRFAELAALDGGTPLMLGERGVQLAVTWGKYYAGWCDKLHGELLGTLDTRAELAYSVPEPLGIVGIIITWNGPLISLGMKVFPALA